MLVDATCRKWVTMARGILNTIVCSKCKPGSCWGGIATRRKCALAKAGDLIREGAGWVPED